MCSEPESCLLAPTVESKLAGKVALVTGSGRGLGRAYALRLARLGADVVISDIRLDSAREIGEALTARSVVEEVEALGRRSIGIEADVRVRTEVETMFERVLREFGRIDILVNNAGGSPLPRERTYASSAPLEDVRSVLDLNLLGTMLCCQVAAQSMKEQHSGVIVNVASIAGLGVWDPESGGRGAPYGVAKAGIIQYTRRLAAELGPYGVRVNCIAPALISTARTDLQYARERAQWIKRIPLGRLGTTEDCAKVVEFLVTDLSDYVTGQCISVCGGLHLGPA